MWLLCVHPEFVTIIEVQFFTWSDVPDCKDADPYKASVRAFICCIACGEPDVGFFARACAVVNVSALEVMRIFCIKVQAIADFNSIVASASLVFCFAYSLPTISGHEFTCLRWLQ